MDGNLVFHDYTHETQDIIQSPGYELQDDDPAVYTDGEDIDHFQPRREWPDRSLPTQSESGTASAQGAHLIKDMLKMHDAQVEILSGMGVDACKEYQVSRIETILKAVRSGQTLCTICKVQFSSAQKLRNHISIIHLGKTNYKCTICDKYFCDSVTLKIHARSHNKEARYIHQCDQCDKKYPSRGKLNEHMQIHGPGFPCDFCKKLFRLKRNKDEHEHGCRSRPDDNPVMKHKCEACGKVYVYNKDLTRHKRTKHRE